MGPKSNLLPSVVRIFNVTLECCSFLFYVFFVLSDSVCAIKATKSIWRTLLGHTTQHADLLLCVSLPSTSEWCSTEHGTMQLTAETDAHSSDGPQNIINIMMGQTAAYTEISAFQ